MEKEPSKTHSIVKADAEMFLQHHKEILDVERELIENSSSAYLMDEQDEMNFMLDALNKGGYAYLVIEEGDVIGFMVVGPLDDGTELPKSIADHYPVQNSLHIKMMYVRDTGQGIGSELMEQLVSEIDREKWRYLFVRTWTDPVNEGAIKFYKEKNGFEPVPGSEVSAVRTKLDKSGTFNIKRQYFSKKVRKRA